MAELKEEARKRENALLKNALKRANGSLREAARLLECPASTLQRALERHPNLERQTRSDA